MGMKLRLLFIFWLFCLAYNSLAQAPPGQGQTPGLGGGLGGGGLGTLTPLPLDTSDIYYFYADNPARSYPLTDTLIERYFTQYDPIRSGNFDAAHLGVLGSASYQLVYQAPFRMGFDMGLHQFDLNRLRTNDLRYYEITQAYTQAFFSQGNNQDNTDLRLQFAREFNGGIQFRMDLLRLNNQGAYEHQTAGHNAFALGFRYQAPGGRYESYFSGLINTNTQEENGGLSSIPTDAAGNPVTLSPVTLPLELSQAETRLSSREYSYTQYWKWRSEQDSSGSNQRAINFYHQAMLEQNEYRFSDPQSAPNNDFYGQFATDVRGLRHYMSWWSLQNTVKLITFRGKETGEKGLRKERDWLEAGLTHRYHRIYQEPVDTSINNLFLHGLWRLSLGAYTHLQTYAHFGLLDHAGDFRLDGQLQFDVPKAGTLRAQLVNQRYTSSLLQQRLFITEMPVWDTSWRKPIETMLAAQYGLPGNWLSFEGRYHLLNNWVYYNTEAKPAQADAAVSLLQLVGRLNLKLKSLHLDNEVVWQRSSRDDVLRVPSLYSRHSLYLQGIIFRRGVLSRIGFDLRLNAPWYLNAYQPASGQFFLQNDFNTGWQPMVDFFLAAKVLKFRLFVRVENLVPLLSNRYYFLTQAHPLQNTGLRIGISWQFVD